MAPRSYTVRRIFANHAKKLNYGFQIFFRIFRECSKNEHQEELGSRTSPGPWFGTGHRTWCVCSRWNRKSWTPRLLQKRNYIKNGVYHLETSLNCCQTKQASKRTKNRKNNFACNQYDWYKAWFSFFFSITEELSQPARDNEIQPMTKALKISSHKGETLISK